MDPSNLRNFKDFLQLYNQMTERCFYKCIEHTNSRQLSQGEMDCVDRCAAKFIKYNNKLMMHFVKNQNDIMTRRMKEMEQQMIENNNSTNSEGASPQEVTVAST